MTKKVTRFGVALLAMTMVAVLPVQSNETGAAPFFGPTPACGQGDDDGDFCSGSMMPCYYPNTAYDFWEE